ncbi:MAG TPA: mechanosensitive ion channel protein MscS, partial [Halieaceae bacterium]|nr:mechanosensitive ion channel protein MscS [Halieaceae bacterium]
FTVGIAYDDTMAAAQTAALEVLRQHPAVLDEPEPLVLVDELAASTVNLRVSYWVDTATYDARKVRSAVIRQVKTAFDLAGISMPSEAREITFPEGVQVALAEPSAPTNTAPAPENPLQPPTSEAGGEAHLAEGGLKNSDDDIEKQARAARLPEGGDNLL